MICKNICDQYALKKEFRRNSLYEKGAKFCGECGIFLYWDKKYCPCCKTPLRVRPKRGVYRNKLLVEVPRI